MTKNLNSAIFLLQKGDLIGQRQKTSYSEPFLGFSLEREKLLSKISGDLTVGSLWNKKGSCSTRRGLRVSTIFREFSQTPRGRGFSLLGFYSFFKYFPNV